MREVVYSTARQKFKELLDEVTGTQEPVKIIRRDHKQEAVVVLSEGKYQALVDGKDCKDEGKIDG